MKRPKSRIKLLAEEMMVMIGARAPKLSERLKVFLDAELAKPQYQGLPSDKAWNLAARHLVLNRPDAFDPDNVHDRVMRKLLPYMVSAKGDKLPPQQMLSHLDMENVAMTHEVRGRDVHLSITAKDDQETRTARYKAPLKADVNPKDLAPFGVHRAPRPAR